MKVLFATLVVFTSFALFAGEKGGNNGPGKELLEASRIYQDTLNCPADLELKEVACAKAEEFQHSMMAIINDEDDENAPTTEELNQFHRSCCGINTGM